MYVRTETNEASKAKLDILSTYASYIKGSRVGVRSSRNDKQIEVKVENPQ